MFRFLNLTLNGVTLGIIYAAVALALVMIWRATRIVNFAQGGMLMITTVQTASIWNVGVIGAAVGFGFYDLGLILALANFLVLAVLTPLKDEHKGRPGDGAELRGDRRRK